MSESNPIYEEIKATVEKEGVFKTFIDTDGYCPRFGYSIGLYKSFNHPEIVVIGLPSNTVGPIIHHAKEEISKSIVFEEGINYYGFLVDYPVQFVKVRKEHYRDYLGYAGWYNGNTLDFPVLQLVWPDKKGLFPWDVNFKKELKFEQPLLDRNEDYNTPQNQGR